MFGVKLLSNNAQVPKRASDGAAGYDLYAAEETLILPGQRALVKTDISICLPEKTYGRVAPRSGLALKSGITVGAGVIDYDYRGNVGVLLFNQGTTEFQVNKGERIAQLIIEVIITPEPIVLEELPETNRGLSGYGSTGK